MASVISATPYAKNSAGLEAKPTYEQVINYIHKDPDKIKYPNRTASILRSSHWLTQLDGEGWNQLETQMALERKTDERNLNERNGAGLQSELRTLETHSGSSQSTSTFWRRTTTTTRRRRWRRRRRTSCTTRSKL